MICLEYNERLTIYFEYDAVLVCHKQDGENVYSARERTVVVIEDRVDGQAISTTVVRRHHHHSNLSDKHCWETARRAEITKAMAETITDKDLRAAVWSAYLQSVGSEGPYAAAAK